MFAVEILKSLATGVCASIPIGPVAFLVLQKTLSNGRRAGKMAGYGCAFVDGMCGVISVLTFSFFSGLIEEYFKPFQIVGGLVLVGIGLSMALKDPFKNRERKLQPASYSPKYFIQGFFTAASNPAALIFMMAIVALWHIDTSVSREFLALDCLAILAGAILYWTFFATMMDKLRNRLSFKTLTVLSRLAGVAVLIFGIILFVKGLFVEGIN